MASSGEVEPADKITGVLVPGDGRLRFCSTTMSALRAGDWVAVDGELGQEPGRVVFEAGQVEHPASLPAGYRTARKLTANELARVETLVARAGLLAREAAHALAGIDANAELESVRLSLDGSTLLCHGFGAGDKKATFEQAVSAATGLSTRSEWSASPASASGSLGRLSSTGGDPSPTIRERLAIDSVGPSDFPNGWPRLGSVVRSAAGAGRLISVSVKHNVATVQLESGDLIQVPVSELAPSPS